MEKPVRDIAAFKSPPMILHRPFFAVVLGCEYLYGIPSYSNADQKFLTSNPLHTIKSIPDFDMLFPYS